MGGLVDLTGEVGRTAVTAASKRDEETVRAALAADLAVASGLALARGTDGMHMRALNSNKEKALATNTKKLETVLYELSLVKSSGRNMTASSLEEPPPAAEE